MQDEAILGHPMRRRWWLLIKALESVPLSDALKFAEAADTFLTAGLTAGQSRKLGEPLGDTATADHSFAPDEHPVAPEAGQDGGLQAVDEALADLTLSGLPEIALEDPESDKHDSVKPVAEEPANDMVPSVSTDACGANQTANGDLAVWASVDDVIRYLRQRDDVVVPRAEGQFLVNGRFSENINELVARANRARERQRKPPFLIVPVSFARAPERSAPDERESATSRKISRFRATPSPQLPLPSGTSPLSN